MADSEDLRKRIAQARDWETVSKRPQPPIKEVNAEKAAIEAERARKDWLRRKAQHERFESLKGEISSIVGTIALLAFGLMFLASLPGSCSGVGYDSGEYRQR